MSLLDDARRLSNGPFPTDEQGYCSICGGTNYLEDHKSDCPWLSMPKIVEILEALERDADNCGPCQSKVYSGIGAFPWACRNGHTVYSSGGPLTARHRIKPSRPNDES